ncbi:MAG: hypothetical protein ABI867_26400 [Kofleriaceae bacterium]
MPTLLATIASQTASLTVALFDAATATEWVPTKPAANKAQFTGHPAQIMRGLAKGEDAAPFDVAGSSGLAFELEGKSGRIEIYRIDRDTLAFVAPPRPSWTGSPEAVEVLFADAFASTDDASDLGEIELTSGRLAAVYMWHKKVGAARDVAVSGDGATTFGDGYGDFDNGAVIAATAGTYRLSKRELVAPWDDGQTLVVVYAVRG